MSLYLRALSAIDTIHYDNLITLLITLLINLSSQFGIHGFTEFSAGSSPSYHLSSSALTVVIICRSFVPPPAFAGFCHQWFKPS